MSIIETTNEECEFDDGIMYEIIYKADKRTGLQTPMKNRDLVFLLPKLEYSIYVS